MGLPCWSSLMARRSVATLRCKPRYQCCFCMQVLLSPLQVGARLDRNGLRPARFWRTKDDMIYVASEVCVRVPR